MEPEAVRADWAARTGRYSPQYYAEIGPDATSEIIGRVLEHYVEADAAICELGCGSGRHLGFLLEAGFENLSGIDINDEAFEVMAAEFPALAEVGRLTVGPLEEVLPTLPDDAFDVVYTVETLQHIHPAEERVFEEVGRVTGDLLLTAENEGNGADRGHGTAATSFVDGEFPLYHRDWRAVFTDLGFAQLLREPTPRDTIRVFRAT